METVKIQVRVSQKGNGYMATAFLPCAENGEIPQVLVRPSELFFNHYLIPHWGELWLEKNIRMSSVYVSSESVEKFIEKQIARIKDIKEFNEMRLSVCGEHTFEI